MNNASENKVNTGKQDANHGQLQGPTNRLVRTNPQVAGQEQFAQGRTVMRTYPQVAYQEHLVHGHTVPGQHYNYDSYLSQSGHQPSTAILDPHFPNHVTAGPHRYVNFRNPHTVPMSTAGVSVATEISGVTYNSPPSKLNIQGAYNSPPSTLTNRDAKTVFKDNSRTTNITEIVTWLYPFKPGKMITEHIIEHIWIQAKRVRLTNNLVIHPDKNYLSLLHPNLEGKDNTVEPYFLFTPKKNRIIQQEQADLIQDDDHEEHLRLYNEFIALARSPREKYTPPARNHKKKKQEGERPDQDRIGKGKTYLLFGQKLG